MKGERSVSWSRGIVIVGVSLLSSSSQAGVLRVPEDYPSVLSAVDAASAGDSVVVGPGTWTDKEARIVMLGGSPVTITACGFLKGGIAVIGAGVDATTVDAGGSGAGLVIPFSFANHLGEEATLEGLTIAGAGSTGKAAHAKDAGRLVIRSCRLNGTTTTQVGGAAVGLDRCDLLLEDSEISFNVSPATAGVYAHECNIQIYRCRFEENQGRAVELGTLSALNPYTVTIEDCEFIGNQGGFGSPVVALQNPYTVQIERNVFLRNASTDTGAGLWVYDSFGTIRFNTFAYDSIKGVSGGAAALLFAYFHGDVSNNTFVGCHADVTPQGSAIVIGMGETGIFNFSNNLFADCTGSQAIGVFAPLPGTCNGFWNNEGGLGDYVPSPTDLFLDPRFCDVPSLDFTLAANSPYAPGNNAGCGQIGAFGVGCGSVAVEAMSWGRLKTLYR